MNNTTKYTILTIHTIISFGIPLLILKNTTSLDSSIRFAIASVLMCLAVVYNIGFHYWLYRYQLVKSSNLGDMLASLLPKMNWQSYFAKIYLGLIALLVGSIILGYGYSKANFIFIGMGGLILYFVNDRVIDILNESFDERIAVLKQQLSRE